MTDTALPTESPGSATRRIWRFFSHPRTLLVVGILTLVVSTFMLWGFVVTHRGLWRADWVCSASNGLNGWARTALGVTGAASFMLLTSSTLWLGFRRSRHPVAIGLFWVATVTLWVVSAPMFQSFSYAANACLRSRVF